MRHVHGGQPYSEAELLLPVSCALRVSHQMRALNSVFIAWQMLSARKSPFTRLVVCLPGLE